MVNNNAQQIFLSYSRPDQDQVEQIARRLDKEGYKVWYDNASLVPGECWSDALYQGLRSSSHCLVFVGSDRLNPWQQEEVRTALDRAVRENQEFRLIPVLLPGAKRPGESELYDGIRNRHWVQFINSVDEEAAWQGLVSGLQGRQPGFTHLGESGPCPYKGIEVYDVADAGLFYGRSRVTDFILTRLRERITQSGHPRFFAIIGPSGTGKSSLARAGVLAGMVNQGLLDDCGGWIDPPLIFKPGNRPINALATELIKHDATRQRFSQWSVAGLESKLRKTANEEYTFLSDEIDAALEGDAYLPVLIDQFEELLKPLTDQVSSERETLQKLEAYNQQQLQPFIGNIFFAARQSAGRLVFIITMRDEFYGQCAFDPLLEVLVSENHKLLTPMASDELRESVEAPARDNGKAVEPALLTLIESDMHNRPGAMPLLQEALKQMWDRCGNTLTSRVYNDIGGIKGALQTKADETCNELVKQSRLSSEVRQTRESLIRQLFLDLIERDAHIPTSRRRERNELPDDAGLGEILDAFTAARLLLRSGDKESGKTYYELTHEALIEHWPKLRVWLEENEEDDRIRQRLEQEAARYASEMEQYQEQPGKWRQIEPDFLLKNRRWDETAQWLDRIPVPPSPLAAQFIDRCRTYSQQQKTRRLKQGGLAMLGLVAVLLLAVYSFWLLTTTKLELLVFNPEHEAIEGYRLYISEKREALGESRVSWFYNMRLKPDQSYWLRLERDSYFPWEREIETGHARDRTEMELQLYPTQWPEMVRIEGGVFSMGSDPSIDLNAENTEQPQHPVVIKAFYLGKYEVTFEEYEAFANATNRELPDDQDWGRERRPVINVNRADAVDYTEWLSQQTGKHYRLPSESEWEYAARAGSTTKYSWGDKIFQDDTFWANCFGCSNQDWDSDGYTVPVGSFEVNTFGLYDMAGNVYEMTQDCWHENYRNAPTFGFAWLEDDKGDCRRYVVRGGSWDSEPPNIRSAARTWAEPEFEYIYLGFRLARDP